MGTHKRAIPLLEALEPRLACSVVLPPAREKATVERMLKEIERLKKTSLPAPARVSGTLSAIVRIGTTARVQASAPPGRVKPPKTYTMETGHLVHDPALQLALSALLDNKIEDNVKEIAGRGGRDKTTGRFVGYPRPKSVEVNLPQPISKPRPQDEFIDALFYGYEADGEG